MPSEMVVLGIFDNPVFQSELLFLLVIIVLFGVIGLFGRSVTLALFGMFLAFEHVVTAVGSNVQTLDTANWAILGLLALYLSFQLFNTLFGGQSTQA